MAELPRVETFKKMVAAISEGLQVRAYGTILGAAADIVLQALGADDDEAKTDRVHLAEVCRQAYIPREAADVITQALDRMEKLGLLTQKNRWQGLEYMAADYLSRRR